MDLKASRLFALPSELGWIGLIWHDGLLRRIVFGSPNIQDVHQRLAEYLTSQSMPKRFSSGQRVKESDRRFAEAVSKVIAKTGLAGAFQIETALPEEVRPLAHSLQKYAAGQPVDFADVPLDLTQMTDFQTRVIECCRAIPYGETVSYGELATAAGSPRGARAVGSVMRKNLFPLIVPCHRVVSRNGLGGFSAPDGIDMKRRLLALEGAVQG